MTSITLNKIKQYELPTLLEWRNDYQTWKWCRQNDFISETDHQRWFERINSHNSTDIMYSIYNSDILVGICGLTSVDRLNQKAEFSLYIGPKYRNRGIAFESLKILVNHAFKHLNLNRIWGEVFEGNPAMNLFSKVGFNTEGVLRDSYFREGKFIDSYLIGLVREDFNL